MVWVYIDYVFKNSYLETRMSVSNIIVNLHVNAEKHTLLIEYFSFSKRALYIFLLCLLIAIDFLQKMVFHYQIYLHVIF